MPTRYPGRLLSATRPTITQSSSGAGMFTGTEVTQYIENGIWASLPGPVRNVVTTVGSQQITITFSSPLSDGGTTITSYRIVAQPDNIVATGASSPITVSGLTNGTNYTFTITAINSSGSGEKVYTTATPNLPGATSIDYLIVAGGGGAYGANGGRQENGGAGAGGLLQGSALTITPNTTYSITVGAGGTSGTSWTNGQNSVAFGQTSIGGGKGGQRRTGAAGGSGGSGGGGGAEAGAAGSGTAGPPRQGYNGGAGQGGGAYVTGGSGGGAGAAGSTGTAQGNMVGGIGVQSSITGTATYYAGGGSTGWSPPVAGGQGGGGASQSGTTGSNGVANTGGGGGTNDGSGGAGGSGIVIVRYSTSFREATVSGSPTYTITGSYRVYQFTGNGSITF